MRGHESRPPVETRPAYHPDANRQSVGNIGDGNAKASGKVNDEWALTAPERVMDREAETFQIHGNTPGALTGSPLTAHQPNRGTPTSGGAMTFVCASGQTPRWSSFGERWGGAVWLASSTTSPEEDRMKVAVWIVSAVLALFFLFVGAAKAFAPWGALEAGAAGVPVILLKVAGFAEMIGAIGLILPALTRVRPILTPIAAVGLVVTMIGATSVNIGLGLPAVAVQTGVAGILSAFVAWARFSGRAAVTPRRSAAAQSEPTLRDASGGRDYAG